MTHEVILKRDNGSRVKIIVTIPTFGGKFEYSIDVLTCEKGKRTWKVPYDEDGYKYRGMSTNDRALFRSKSILLSVSPEEIYRAKLQLWEKIKPTL